MRRAGGLCPFKTIVVPHGQRIFEPKLVGIPVIFWETCFPSIIVIGVVLRRGTGHHQPNFLVGWKRGKSDRGIGFRMQCSVTGHAIGLYGDESPTPTRFLIGVVHFGMSFEMHLERVGTVCIGHLRKQLDGVVAVILGRLTILNGKMQLAQVHGL